MSEAPEESEQESKQEQQKKAAISSVNRDKSLSAVERQKRIQAILRGANFSTLNMNSSGVESANNNNENSSNNNNNVAALVAPSTVSYYSGSDALVDLSSPVGEGRDNSANSVDGSKAVFGCAHFKRDLYLLAPCCNKWYVCRVCHDEQEDHVLDRAHIARQCCMFCLTPTPVAQRCTSAACHDRLLAHYYCEKCHTHRKETDLRFWHCDKCGMCRSGSLKYEYEHCDRCNLCYPRKEFAKHHCLQASSDTQSCPICAQNIQSSQRPVVAMRCGHGIHVDCLQKLYSQRDVRALRCPLCKQSFEDMQMLWVQMDSAISATVMPEPERYWTAHIGCNDCHAHTESAPFHYYGLKCGNTACGSYNTFIVELRKVGLAEQEEESGEERNEGDGEEEEEEKEGREEEDGEEQEEEDDATMSE